MEKEEVTFRLQEETKKPSSQNRKGFRLGQVGFAELGTNTRLGYTDTQELYFLQML